MRLEINTVLINLLSVRAGGQITRAKAFLSRIRRYDPSSKLIVLRATYTPDFADYSALGVEFVTVEFPFEHFLALQRMAWEQFFLPRLLPRLEVDVYISFGHHLPSTFPNAVYSLIGVSNLAPFSKAAWNSEGYAIRSRMFLQRQAILSSVKRASKVLALSKTCKEILVRNGVDDENIFVSPNGVEQTLSAIEPNSKLLRAHMIDRPYVLYVSHFHRYKNHLRLIDAFSILPEPARSAFKLVLVGEPCNRKYYREVLAKVDSKGLKVNVAVIPGLNREELSILYSNATLFVFPSLIENSPNILLEAMCFGLPILSSSFDPMPEFCGRVAMYFDPYSVTDLSNKLECCMRNKDRLERMGRNARKRSRRYSWDTFMENVTSLYLNRK